MEVKKKTMPGTTYGISNTILMGIGLIVVAIAMLSTIGIVIQQVELASYGSATWNFTGAAGAKSLLGLIPFAWIAGIVVLCVVGAFELARGMRGK
jgi:hypothetical protein